MDGDNEGGVNTKIQICVHHFPLLRINWTITH